MAQSFLLPSAPSGKQLEKALPIMAQSIPLPPAPSGKQLKKALPIIGEEYCLPYPVDLAVVKKVMNISNGNFVVKDISGNVILIVKGKLLALHGQRVLLDAVGNPVVTLREKILSVHDRWEVYKGESKDIDDLLFTVKRSSMIQLKAKLHVFLANNIKEEVCDFRVEGSWPETTCVVYAAESPNIIARMSKKTSIRSVLLGKDNFSVTIYPNVDYAFIVSLIVILEDMIN